MAFDSILGEIEVSPPYNDINWAAYFASGNTDYLDNILKNTPYDLEREDLNLFMTGFSAKWSLCSNARQDKNVKAYLESVEEGEKYPIAEILEKEPYEFREKAIQVVKEQREKGVWK